MRADLPKLGWSPKIAERLELKPSAPPNEEKKRRYPAPGDAPFDLAAAEKAFRKKRTLIPIDAVMSDAAVRFWFFAGSSTAVAIDDAVDAGKERDLSKAPTLEEVEVAFRGICTAGRWDIPQPQALLPLLPRIISWDDTIRLLLEHKNAWTVSAMLAALPRPETCGASKKDTQRGRHRLLAFVDSSENAGENSVGAALQLVHYPDGVVRFFSACKERYRKRIATKLGGPLLVQMPTAKEAYNTAKKFKIALSARHICDLVERFGFEDADLLVAACAKNHEELKRIMRLRTPVAVPGWLALLKKPALVDFAEHYLLTEGANAIEGLIKTVARRGQKRDEALRLLTRHLEAGHEALIRELMSDETKKIQELIEAHVLADDDDATPELPESDWPTWMKKLVADAPKAPPETVKKLLPSQLPVVRNADGAYRIPDRVLTALLWRIATTSGSAPAALRRASEQFHEDDKGPFAELFFDRWFSAKRPDPEQTWVVSLIEHFGGPAEAAKLGATLASSKWRRSRPKAMGVLGRMETPEALTALCRVSHRQRKAQKLLEEVATKWNCKWDELLDRIVPTCGLNDLHCLELDFGKRKPIAAVLPPSRIVIVDRDSGDVFQKLPPRRKVDDKELYGQAREKYKLLRKSLSQIADEQIPRLERAMVSDRRFTTDHWRAHLSLHAVLGPIVCTLVWKTKRDGRWVLFMPTHPDDTCIDTNYDEVTLGDEIALAHPADMTPEDQSAWAGVIADSEIVQPFDQLARLALRAGTVEATQELERLRSTKRTGYDLMRWMNERGWRPKNKDKTCPSYESKVGEWAAVATVDPPAPAWNWPPSGEHVISGIHFKKGGARVDDAEVPAVIYSERLRSLLK
ncbi:MAG: DUF4132 domain-containing protein [Myxococcota bacterium]